MMYWKKSPIQLSAVVPLILCFLLIFPVEGVEGQLNFSTGWGKRTKNLQSQTTSDTSCTSQQPPSLERLINLYKLIEIEARWMVNCQKSFQR